VEFSLPPKQLLDFMVQSVNANQLLLRKHVPDVFDGDIVIFSAARSGNANDGGRGLKSRLQGLGTRMAIRSKLRKWRHYVAGDIAAHSVDCTHHDMLHTASLNMYAAELKLALES